MYRCQICGNTSQPHTPAYKITIAIRPVNYTSREKVNACYKRRRNKFGELESKFIRTDDPGGHGYESVSEVTACPTCAANFQAQQRGQPEPEAATPKARAAQAAKGG